MPQNSVAERIDRLRRQFQETKSAAKHREDASSPTVNFNNFQNFPTDFHDWDQFNSFDNFENFQDN
jgi:hypothetical protein